MRSDGCFTSRRREDTLRMRSVRGCYVASQTWSGKLKPDHVGYLLVMEYRSQQWMVCRRFSDLVKLHAVLEQEGVVLPRRPHRRLSRGLSSKREGEVEQYLQEVLEVMAHLGHGQEVLCRFFKFSPQPGESTHCPLATLFEKHRVF